MTMTSRVSISLDEDQVKLLNSIQGFGVKKAEKVKNMMMAYLSDRGYIEEFNKRGKKK